MLEFILKAIL